MRSPGGFLWLVVTLLAAGVCVSACGGGGGGGASQPTTTTTTTPSTTNSTTKGAPLTSTASVQGDFISLLPDGHTRLALSTDGQKMIAYACDGDDSNPPTFAPWFRGSVSDNSVNLDSTSGGDRLLASLTTPQDAVGTLTLKDGTSHTLTADLLSSADNAAGSGLYRGRATFDGVDYLAGWIVDKPEPGDLPHSGGAIVNQQTGELIAAPQLTDEDISSMQVTAPNLGGTFTLTKCHLGTC